MREAWWIGWPKHEDTCPLCRSWSADQAAVRAAVEARGQDEEGCVTAPAP